MAANLDHPEIQRKLDPQNMLSYIEGFKKQCSHGEELARKFTLPDADGVENILICGMGGSAIGGDILRAYVSGEISVPVDVIRNYTLPNYVSEKSLVIISSYSGNTEETFSAYYDAKRRSAKIVAITAGGKLGEACKQYKHPFLEIPGGYSPRAALGYSFIPLLVFFERWDFIANQAEAIEHMHHMLDQSIQSNQFSVPESDSPAKQLARKLFRTVPVIYAGEGPFQPIAARWRAQLNENAKNYARDFTIPEMNHNEILGWSHPDSVLKTFHVLYLLDHGYHDQIKKRFEVMKSIIQPAVNGITEVHSEGAELLGRLFSLINLGDFVSVYLAYLNQQDPTPIPAIDQLKSSL